MSQHRSVTCDVCGKTKELKESGLFGLAAYGWLRITGLVPVLTSEMPHEYEARQPDFCSYKCLGEFALARAGVSP